jgi:hypothetical protein
VVFSKRIVGVRSMCSPCYPNQADLDSGEGDFLAYALPEDAEYVEGDQFNSQMNEQIPEWMTSEFAVADREGKLRFIVSEDDGRDVYEDVFQSYEEAKQRFDRVKEDEPLSLRLRVAVVASGNDEEGYEFEDTEDSIESFSSEE